MEIILLERVQGLGGIGDLVKVRDGYGRNFLLPQKKALRATEKNKTEVESRRAALEAESAKQHAAAEKIAAKLKGITVTLARQASDDGKLYGSVVPRDIADAMIAEGYEIERRMVELAAPIKNTGSFTAQVVLHADITVDVKVNVTSSDGAPVELTETNEKAEIETVDAPSETEESPAA